MDLYNIRLAFNERSVYAHVIFLFQNIIRQYNFNLLQIYNMYRFLIFIKTSSKCFVKKQWKDFHQIHRNQSVKTLHLFIKTLKCRFRHIAVEVNKFVEIILCVKRNRVLRTLFTNLNVVVSTGNYFREANNSNTGLYCFIFTLLECIRFWLKNVKITIIIIYRKLKSMTIQMTELHQMS